MTGSQMLIAWRIVLRGVVGWFIDTPTNLMLFWRGGDFPITARAAHPGAVPRPLARANQPDPAHLGCSGIRVRSSRVCCRESPCCSAFARCCCSACFSYNDATYTTAFWTSLWLIWWASRLNSPVSAVHHGIAIGQGIIGLCFFGGFIGKLTPEYWSGEAFFHLYMVQKGFPSVRLDPGASGPETMRFWATWFARVMIVAEGFLATLILWPTRVAAIGTACVFALMIFLATPQLSLCSGPSPGS